MYQTSPKAPSFAFGRAVGMLICKILATYPDETVLNEAGKIDYRTFKPVLFEFPTYEYFVTGDAVGMCRKMN